MQEYFRDCHEREKDVYKRQVMNMKKFLIALSLLAFLVAGGCSFVHYSFSGTSIQSDVKTVTVIILNIRL